MNEKAFTLIELVVTIVILLAIASIAIPNIASITNKNKQKQISRIEQIIIDAKDTYFNFNESETEVTIETLINKKLIDEDDIIDIIYKSCNVKKDDIKLEDACFK